MGRLNEVLKRVQSEERVELLALLNNHFPVDVSESDDTERWFHCACGYSGTCGLTRDDWLAHFGEMLVREAS